MFGAVASVTPTVYDVLNIWISEIGIKILTRCMANNIIGKYYEITIKYVKVI